MLLSSSRAHDKRLCLKGAEQAQIRRQSFKERPCDCLQQALDIFEVQPSSLDKSLYVRYPLREPRLATAQDLAYESGPRNLQCFKPLKHTWPTTRTRYENG